MSELTSQAKPARNASLDLLRILSMLMIVIMHCLGHGGILNNAQLYSFGYFTGWTIEGFCYVAVNCYVLISGYFLCEGSFKLKKLFTLYGSVWFWSALLFAVFCVAGATAFSAKDLIKVCLPFTQQAYWFVTTYLLMYILSPFLNLAIRAMNKRQHAAAIAVFFAVYIFLQNLTFWQEFTLVGSHDPMFFIFLYFVAAYIRRYPPQKKRPWLLVYVICAVFTAASRFILTYITTPIFGQPVGETAFYSYNSVYTVVGSVSLFLFFRGLRVRGIRFSRLITAVAPLTFGVYLIHDNNFVRPFLWQGIIKPERWIDSPWMIFLVIGASIAIFVLCCCVEKVRLLLRKIINVDACVHRFASFAERRCAGIIDKLSIFNSETAD